MHVSHLKPCTDPMRPPASLPPPEGKVSEEASLGHAAAEDDDDNERDGNLLERKYSEEEEALSLATAEAEESRDGEATDDDVDDFDEDELVSYDVNDDVWLYTTARRWHGPYAVLQRVTPVSWMLESRVNERKQQVLVHTLQMRPYHADRPPEFVPDMARVQKELRETEVPRREARRRSVTFADPVSAVASYLYDN